MNAPNMQAVLIRAAVLLVMCLGFSIAMIGHKPAQANLVQAPVAAAARATSAVAAEHPPMIVTPTTMLPTISVRPSAAEIAAAMNDDTSSFDEDAPKFIKAAQQRPLFDTTVSLRSLRLDMPYYSFGKVLPRVSKE
jgi:hypothetical protein